MDNGSEIDIAWCAKNCKSFLERQKTPVWSITNIQTEIEHTEEGVIGSDLNKRPQVEEEMDRICAKRVTDG